MKTEEKIFTEDRNKATKFGAKRPAFRGNLSSLVLPFRGAAKPLGEVGRANLRLLLTVHSPPSTVLILFLLLTVHSPQSTAHASWSTNWPAYEHPRDLRQQVLDCYSGVVERCVAVGNELPSSPAWYRTFRSEAQTLKDEIQSWFYNARYGGGEGMVYHSYFLNTALSSGGTFDSWYTTQTCSNSVFDPFPETTEIGVLVAAALPTNFFEYTPSRSELCGLGGFTNDLPTIGHAHGYTNTTTAAGGTNFPAGRSTWYTTDYGVDGIKAVLGQLIWTRMWNPAGVSIAATNQGGYYPSAVSWADAKANAEPITSNNLGVTWYGTLGADVGYWYAGWHGRPWSYAVTGFPTTTDKTIEYYSFGIHNYNSLPGTIVFGDHGTGIRSNVYTRLIACDMGFSAASTSAVSGLSLPLSWCETPDPSTVFDPLDSFLGFWLGRTEAFVKWTFDYP